MMQKIKEAIHISIKYHNIGIDIEAGNGPGLMHLKWPWKLLWLCGKKKFHIEELKATYKTL